MLSVGKASVGSERAQERLLERVLRPLGAQPSPQQPEYGVPIVGVEKLERRDLGSRHHVHHRVETPIDTDL
jgi:hypothetical protein